VNQQVKKATNRQKLADYQTKLDVSGLEKAHHPGIQMFKVCTDVRVASKLAFLFSGGYILVVGYLHIFKRKIFKALNVL